MAKHAFAGSFGKIGATGFSYEISFEWGNGLTYILA